MNRAFRAVALFSGAAAVVRLYAIRLQLEGWTMARDLDLGLGPSAEEIEWLIAREEWVARVFLVIAIAYVIALAIYTGVANRALRDAGVPHLRRTPREAALLYLVPLYNLYHVLAASQELHRASLHDPKTADLFDWRNEESSARISGGWILALAAFLVTISVSRFIGETPDPGVLSVAIVFYILASVFAIASTVLYLAAFARITRRIDALTAEPQPEEPMSKIRFEFRPRWKEELVCSSVLGNLVLDMPMGVTSVYLPTEGSWARQAPQWARAMWPEFHAQLVQWCASERVPLYVEDSASVYEEDPRLVSATSSR